MHGSERPKGAGPEHLPVVLEGNQSLYQSIAGSRLGLSEGAQ
jgi:hypothetical protein